ncbi:MAG TPA: bifunctional glutamate N-acetyltransferase/amino-acid acetyltransferase ArgJ, partial [Dehalococcoidia bacterium]
MIDVPDGTITTPLGFVAGAVHAGIKYPEPDRLDFALLCSARPCTASGVFTQSAFAGPPVKITRRNLGNGRAQAIVVNSGISNSLFGEEGMLRGEEMAQLAAERLGVDAADVIVASTGVTGWRLPVERMRDAAPAIQLARDGGESFARAIMTTDLVHKQACVRFEANGTTYTVGGCAKGVGMIEPNMATMLAFMTTDAPVEVDALRALVRETADVSLNMLVVDGDTSPNDTFVLLANGAAGGEEIGARSPELPLLKAAVERVAISLTKQLARDGEGASKLIEITVEGAASDDDARRAAKTIARSPLVKTAMYGNDPNWGRILVAIGYSGARAEEARTSLWLQETEVFIAGTAVGYDEAALSAALAGDTVHMRVDLGLGNASATAYTC